MRSQTNIKSVLKKFEDWNVEFLDLKVLDLRGKIHSLMLPARMMNEKLLDLGVGFDASSYGFAKPEKSDMVMIPDLDTLTLDPFREKTTAMFMANIHMTDSNRTRFSSDPRFIAEKAEKYIEKSKIGTQALFGPEFEFFIFKEVSFGVSEEGNYYFVKKDSDEKRNFYHSASPDDEYIDFKNEAVSILKAMGVDVKYHHHEVAVNQHEIETTFNSLLRSGDQATMIKYVLFNLAKKRNLFITFMPKPFYQKAGNGWHVHQYIMNKGKNIFYDKGKYANLSRSGFSYISGLLFHAGSLCAFSNPSTNSYKRLVKGFEAPVAAIFATSNRNAAVRIPSYVEPKETRIEYRSGDATSNPYLFLSAMLMAGCDGIQKNLIPEKYNFGPFEEGLIEPKGFKNRIKELPAQLSEALDMLEKDKEYLKYGAVFDENVIGQWIKLKRQEIVEVNQVPHPKEFELYFNF